MNQNIIKISRKSDRPITIKSCNRDRRQGVGTKNLYFIEDTAKEKAKDKIRLSVIDGNPALSLYRRHGFQIIEDKEWLVLMSENVAI